MTETTTVPTTPEETMETTPVTQPVIETPAPGEVTTPEVLEAPVATPEVK